MVFFAFRRFSNDLEWILYYRQFFFAVFGETMAMVVRT
jgi:hypothetical protein